MRYDIDLLGYYVLGCFVLRIRYILYNISIILHSNVSVHIYHVARYPARPKGKETKTPFGV